MNTVEAKRLVRVIEEFSMNTSLCRIIDQDESESGLEIIVNQQDELQKVDGPAEEGAHEDIQYLVENVTKLASIVAQRLSVTVEEDSSTHLYFMQACRRETKALKEKQNLEHVLRLERHDRSAQALILSTAQRKTQADLEEVAAVRNQKFSELSANADNHVEENQVKYDGLEGNLQQEIHRLEQEMDALQQANRVSESALQRKKAKAEQEVEVWLQKYTEESGLKQAELDEATSSYNTVVLELEEATRRHSELFEERLAYEARKQVEEQARRAKIIEERRRGRAAKTIQKVWRDHQVRLLAMKKAAAKAEGKGKKAAGKPKRA